MKCPFLIKRIDVFDEKGKKVGEEIEIQECIKNKCMVYDGATNLCSLLSSNMKAGVIIDDIKNVFGNIKKEINQHAEAISVVVSNSIQTIQDALLDRFEILRKQNEVMVLGFDHLSEVFTNKMGEVNANFSNFNDKIINNFDTLRKTISDQGDEIKPVAQSLQSAFTEIKNTNMQL